MQPPRLELTPVDQAQQEAEEQARLSQYRRAYWQQYKKRCRRVYGTLSVEAYAEIKAIAEASGRSVWEEIWQQSQAYRQQAYLPPETIREAIEGLYGELRRINDRLNRLGEDNGRVSRLLAAQKVSAQLKVLEQSIERFTTHPWQAP